MSKANRNQPKRSSASESRYSLMEFERDFPDDAACLDWLVGHLYPDGIFCPKCEKVTRHHRVKTRTCYACQFCGHQEYPMKGTIFEDSATSLRLWFHAFYLMAQTRCGISAKQLERELGVTYKTAWRIFNKIRSLLGPDDEPMKGTVEMDETYLGGRRRRGKTGRPSGKDKPAVFGIAQRRSLGQPAKIVAQHVPNAQAISLMPHVQKRVLPSAMIYTDEWQSYRSLWRHGYLWHERINHAAEVYVSGDVHTNTIEGFWSLLKGGIRGVYHSVSTAHLQSYLDEFTFRYNNRDMVSERGMFGAFLSRIGKAQEAAS